MKIKNINIYGVSNVYNAAKIILKQVPKFCSNKYPRMLIVNALLKCSNYNSINLIFNILFNIS